MAEREYAGCIHVHSAFSDGHSPVERILEAAAEAGLDFLVVTDHNSNACSRCGLTGWHGGLLCLSAPEIGHHHQPHFIAFGLRDVEALAELDPPSALEAARRQGATNFIAHPHPAEMSFYPSQPVGWPHWTGDAYSGIEVWSYMHDVCHRAIPWRLGRLFRSHRSMIRGPRPETLQLWDRLCRRRRVSGIGALDNHARWLPLVGEVFPHADLFRLLRTHVVCGELPGDAEAAERELVAALAEGRGFAAMDGWSPAAGFRAWAEGPAGTLTFGQEAPYEAGWRLRVTLPRDADVTVLRDGEPAASREKTGALELAVESPGVYRTEVRLEGRPWVFSNPIYLRES